MPLTHFPKGITSFGIPVLGAGDLFTTTGSVFFVDSGHAAANNGENAANGPDRPFSTIDYAVGRCTANNGDLIIIMPGHVETVSAAGGLDLDVAGITLVGLGSGNARPQIAFTTATTADMDVDAADIRMHNVRFTGGIDALAAPIDVNAARFHLSSWRWEDGSALQPTDVVVADANADGLILEDFVYEGDTAAGTNAAIALTGCDDVVIRNFLMDGNFAVGGIDIRTTAVLDLQVYNGRFRTRNAADIFLIDTITGSTGMIGPQLYLRLQDNAANITEAITGATFVVMDDVYVVNAANEKGLLINWTASADL